MYEDIIGAMQAAQFGSYNDIIGAPFAYTAFGADPGAAAAYGMQVAAACQPQMPDPALMSLIAARNSLGVMPRCPSRARRELLGFPRTTIAAGDTDTLNTQPQVLAKIFRIIIPSDIAFQLLINDFKIGKWSLLANNDPVPAAALDELATDVDIDPDTAQVNTVISCTLENTSNADVDVRMCAFVKAIE